MTVNCCFQIITTTDRRWTDVHNLHKPQTHIKTLQRPAIKPRLAKTEVAVKAAKSQSRILKAQGNDAACSEIIITFWTAEKYHELQELGLSQWQHIDIRDTPCTSAQKAQLEPLIEELIIHAIQATKQHNTPGLRVKPGKPKFRFTNNCQAQWLPAHNVFDLEVKNGEGGRCEDASIECVGWFILGSRHGRLVQDNDPGEFYDTTTDDEVLERHHAALGGS